MSSFIIKNNSFKFSQDSKRLKETETFFYNEENKDITKIKEEIDKVNNPKIELIPDDNLAPKDYFQQNKILIMGDSLVEGLEAYGVLYSSNTIWKREERIDNMQEQLKQAVSYNPNAIILAYGLNDIRLWNGNVNGYINAYSNSLDTIINTLPNKEIYVCAILPVSNESTAKDSSFQYIALFNERLKQLCNEKNIQLIDSSYLLKNVDNPYGPDGIHPKAFFYQEWANDIMNKMR